MTTFREPNKSQDNWTEELNNASIKVEIKRLREEFNTSKNEDNSIDRILDIYKTIADTRKFEIENYWKRTLFFWGTLAIVLIGFYKIDDLHSEYKIFIALLGLFYNIIFSLSLRGSKYWQEHWEHAAIIYENELSFRIFSWKLFETVNQKYKNSKHFKPYKFSVSKLTMILGDITAILFFFLVLFETETLLKKGIISYSSNSNFSTLSFLIHTFTFIGFSAILSLISKLYYESYSKNQSRPLIVGVIYFLLFFLWYDVIMVWITLFIPNNLFIWVREKIKEMFEKKKEEL